VFRCSFLCAGAYGQYMKKRLQKMGNLRNLSTWTRRRTGSGGPVAAAMGPDWTSTHQRTIHRMAVMYRRRVVYQQT
jgi:hypothetical protein